MKTKDFQAAKIQPLTSGEIRAWRKANKIGLLKLARIMGIHVSTVWRWEHDGYQKAPKYLSLVFRGIEALYLKKKK